MSSATGRGLRSVISSSMILRKARFDSARAKGEREEEGLAAAAEEVEARKAAASALSCMYA